MATPKKSSKSASAAKPAAAKSAGAADKPAAAAKQSPVPPVVNLTLAAQSAAMLLAARRKREAAATDAKTDYVDAAAFKQIKSGGTPSQFAANSPLAGLNKSVKPTGGTPGYAKSFGQNPAGGKNVARTGVPRRTSGG